MIRKSLSLLVLATLFATPVAQADPCWGCGLRAQPATPPPPPPPPAVVEKQ